MNPPASGFLPCALHDGDVVATEDLRLSPLGAGFMFGEGIFETIRVRAARPQRLEAHHARLAAAAVVLGATPVSSCAELHDRCRRLIEANGQTDGSLKLILFRDVAGWTELILARPPPAGADRPAAGFRLRTLAGDQRVAPLHGLKSLNYLTNIRAKRQALADGCDETLFIAPDGQVLEGATTNVFIVQNRTVSTPPLSTGILPGVMRAQVLRLSAPAAVRERAITLVEMLAANEVFVTNALLGIMPVAQVDARAYDLTANATTRALMAALG